MDWLAAERCAIERGCEVQREASLKSYTSFRIGGPATLLITPPNETAAAGLLTDLAAIEVPVTVIGNGSNLLISDAGVSGVVLRIGGDETAPVRAENRVRCTAALPLKALCRFAREQGLAGLEPLYGIPGTVGGAVFMNAGAYGGSVADTLVSVTVANRAGKVRQCSAGELELDYRHSKLMETGEIVLAAEFALSPDDPAAIGDRMADFLARRRDKQPLEYPSAGSFFKRPQGHFAGALIESCGLKGARVGDAEVSEKHAGFIINRGNATYDDVKELMRQVQETVLRQHGVQLVPEVQFLGEE